MLSFKIRDWKVFSPDLSSSDHWLLNSNSDEHLHPSISADDTSLKKIPPMLRRRFSDIGKCAVNASLPLLNTEKAIPLVFASRHGDIKLAFSLLETIAKGDPISPTHFSLAVHNATGGLLSIARKDVSEVTSIASIHALIPCALLEAATQLQEHDEILCIVCDTSLPQLYTPYSESSHGPYAIAMILSKISGETFFIEHQEQSNPEISYESQLIAFLSLLNNQCNTTSFTDPDIHSEWVIKR